MECRECVAYDLDKRHCHRFPVVAEKGLSDWCMEFKAKEVIQDAVAERKIEESSVIEHQGVDALGEAPKAGDSDSDGQGWEIKKEEEIRKRGWPKGKPRK